MSTLSSSRGAVGNRWVTAASPYTSPEGLCSMNSTVANAGAPAMMLRTAPIRTRRTDIPHLQTNVNTYSVAAKINANSTLAACYMILSRPTKRVNNQGPGAGVQGPEAGAGSWEPGVGGRGPGAGGREPGTASRGLLHFPHRFLDDRGYLAIVAPLPRGTSAATRPNRPPWGRGWGLGNSSRPRLEFASGAAIQGCGSRACHAHYPSCNA